MSFPTVWFCIPQEVSFDLSYVDAYALKHEVVNAVENHPGKYDQRGKIPYQIGNRLSAVADSGAVKSERRRINSGNRDHRVFLDVYRVLEFDQYLLS